MFQVDKYYPVQGVNKFQTISFPITKGVAVDFGAVSASGVVVLDTIPKGALVLSIWGRMTEAYETAGTGAGFTLGLTGTPLLSSAHGSSSAGLGVIVAPPDSSGMSIVLTANDTVDLTIGTSGAATAGKMDVYISYIPTPVGDLTTADFLSVIAT
jgi:hypothetical protein